MRAFWTGFEKRADEKEDDSSALSLGAGLLSPAAGLPFTAGAVMAGNRERMMSPSSVKRFAGNVSSARNIDPKIMHTKPHFIASVYNPVTNEIELSGRSPPSIAAHELGHASSVGKLWNKGKLPGKAATMAMALGKASTFLPGLALATGTETGEKIAPYAGLIGAAPQIIEEMSATGRGLRDLKRFGPKGSLLRAVPTLGLALGSYVAPPAISGYVTKKIIDARKRNAAERKPV